MFWPWFLHIQMLTQKRTLCQRKRKPPPSMWECWMEASALTTCFRRSPLKVLMNIYLLYKAICATGKCSFLFGGFSDSSVKLLNHVRLCDPVDCSTPGFLSITNSWSSLKLKSIVSVMPSNHLILCRPLFFLLQSFPASGSFPMSQFFASGGQSIGASASASVLPENI